MIAFGDVLFAAACGLHHLVDGAVAFTQIVFGEVVGGVVDDFGNLINAEVAIVPMLRKESDGRTRSGRSILSILSTLIILIVRIVYELFLFRNRAAAEAAALKQDS